MPVPNTRSALASQMRDLLVSLSCHVPSVQSRMDAHFLRDMDDFAPIRELTGGTPFESLAKAVQPSPLVLQEVSLSVQFTFGKSLEKGVRVRVFNAQFQSRYGSSVQHSEIVGFTVRRVPLQ